jgi:hypothetical protein
VIEVEETFTTAVNVVLLADLIVVVAEGCGLTRQGISEHMSLIVKN